MAQTTTIHLMTGDYPDRIRKALAAAQAAEQDDTPLLGGEEHPYDVLVREYEELKAEAEKASEKAKRKVVLQAIGRRNGQEGRPSWRDLKVAHPPRTEGDPEVVKGDRLAGVNADTVEDDLLYASVIVPKFTSRGAFDEWADGLSEGEFRTLVNRAWRLANVAEADPKSLPALPTRTSGENTQ